MIAKILDFVKANFTVIALGILIALFVLFSFAAGYIMATYQNRQPISIEQTTP